jgi:hypothetical protein
MSILVFTPTAQWGGLDIAWASICRQTVAKEITWLVADEHYSARRLLYPGFNDSHRCAGVIGYKQPDRPGYPKNLTSAYIYALGVARTLKCDVFVSMQDYFWIPPDGVEKMAQWCRENDPCLPTGLASMTDNPTAEEVIDPLGHLTVFKEPFTGKPRETFWWSDIDVRGQGSTSGNYPIRNPQCWELNWCAISKTILYDESIAFDPEFDRGIAYDHQDYALQAIQKYGCNVIVDRENHALGLPHKLYFPEVTDANGLLCEPNRQLLWEKRGI